MEFTAALKAFATTLERLELPEDRLADPEIQERLGRRAALLATSELTWEEHLGPLYEWSDVASLLGTVRTRQGVNDLAKRQRLLGLPTSSGRLLYPAFQFKSGRPVQGLPEVLAALQASGMSPWTLASWLVTKQPELGEKCPIDHLRRAGADELLLSATRRTARRLAA